MEADSVCHVESTKELEELWRGHPGTPIVCDLWASWCAPCKRVEPAFIAVAQENALKRVVFAKVNAEKCRDFLVEHNIRSVPTFLILRDGEIVERMTGACPKPTLESFCSKAWCEDE
ncbi:MAG: thioredoxin family protein [Promethearchaeota archaeon]